MKSVPSRLFRSPSPSSRRARGPGNGALAAWLDFNIIASAQKEQRLYENAMEQLKVEMRFFLPPPFCS
jgi:hypothetical protein